MEYKNIKIDPLFAFKLFKATDSKGNLHVDTLVNSVGFSTKKWVDEHGDEVVSNVASKLRKEVPGLIEEATMSGLHVVQNNSMMLMMPMMMALNSYFAKQMEELKISSAKKSRSEAAKKGYANRFKNVNRVKEV